MRWLLVLALVACSDERGPRWRAAGSPTPRDGGTLRIASPGSVSTLDPATAYDEISIYVLHAIVEGLVGFDDNVVLVPRLAERWQISTDGLTYTFTLRDDIRYADGRPIVAADFKRAFERVLGMPSSPYGTHLAGIVGAQAVIDGKALDCSGISTPDPRTLVLQLSTPNAALLNELAMVWAAPITAESNAIGASLRREPLASGPYELVEWDEGRFVELRRRTHYHDRTRQHLDRIVLHENVPRDLQFMMLERGELDAAAPLTGSDLRWVEQQPAWAPYVLRRPLMNAYGSRINTRVKPFDDKRVRQALNYALDKDRIVRLLLDTAVPAHGTLPPGTFGRDESLAPYPHDPAKARALLREAGYPNGFSVTYLTLADEEAEKLAISLQHDLREVGIEVEISTITLSGLSDALTKPDAPPLAVIPWGGDFPDPISLLDPVFHSRNIGGTNFSSYSNPELDKLLDDAHLEQDPTKRAQLYRRAERILYDDAPWIWGYHQVAIEVVQPYVRNYGPHPVWYRDLPSAWLDLDADGKPVPR